MRKSTRENKLLIWAYLHRKKIALTIVGIMIFSLLANLYISLKSEPSNVVQQIKDAQEQEAQIAAENLYILEINSHINAFLTAVNAADYTTAIEEITYVIEHDAPTADYYLKRGGTYILTNEYEKAMQDLETSLKLDKEQPEVYSLIGQIHMLQENHEAALENLEQALSLGLSSPEIHYNIAICFCTREDYESAKEHLTLTLEGDCDDTLRTEAQSLLELIP